MYRTPNCCCQFKGDRAFETSLHCDKKFVVSIRALSDGTIPEKQPRCWNLLK